MTYFLLSNNTSDYYDVDIVKTPTATLDLRQIVVVFIGYKNVGWNENIIENQC